MTFRVVIFSIFLGATFAPIGWNKFDIVRQADLLFALGPMLLLLATLSLKKLQSRKKEIELLLVFFGLIIASFYHSKIQNYGWNELVVIGSGIALYFIAQTFSEKEKNFFAGIVTLFATASSLFAFYWYLNFSENRLAGFFFESDIKAHFWPNAFALFLLMSWPLALEFFKNFTSRRAKILKIIALSILFSAIILTFSRAALIVLVLQFILLFWKSHFQKTAQNFLTGILIALLTGIIVFGLQQIRKAEFPVNSFQEKITFQGTERQTSVDERKQFFEGGLKLALEKPLLGHGPGTFRFLYATIQKNFLATSDHPHNFLIKFAAENGIMTAIIFIIFLCIIAAAQLRNPSLFGLAAFGAVMHNLVDYNFNFLTNALLFWVLLGLSNPIEPEEKMPKKTRVLHTIIITALTLILAASTAYEAYLAYKLRSATDTAFYKKAQFPRDYFAGRNTEKDLLFHLEKNPLDAFAWNALGHLEEKKGDHEAAYYSYKKAVENNPANFFNFYVDYFRTAQKIGASSRTDPDQKTYKQKALEFLKTYPDKVRANIHYTAQTGNVQAAINLAKLLGQPELAKKIEQAKMQLK